MLTAAEMHQSLKNVHYQDITSQMKYVSQE